MEKVEKKQFEDCPNCLCKLIKGHIGPPWWIRWYGKRQSVYYFFPLMLFKTKRFSKSNSKNLIAWSCPSCGLLLFYGDRICHGE